MKINIIKYFYIGKYCKIINLHLIGNNNNFSIHFILLNFNFNFDQSEVR